MKKSNWDTMNNSLVLIGILILLLAAAPMVALAGSDGDGFPDEVELQGIVLLDETIVVTNPNVPTIFVYIQENPECPTLDDPDDDPLQYLAEGGLGYEVIPLSEDQIDEDRYISEGLLQKAARVRISCDPNGGIVGQANYGTLNDLDEAVVYVERIRNLVIKVYDDNKDVIPDKSEAIIAKYIKQTIAHEIGHTIRCAPDYSLSYGFHFAPKTNVIMDQYVWYKVKRAKKKVIWKIGKSFSQPSVDGAILSTPN